MLTTQVINWARSSVREIDLARRLMHHAVAHGTVPKQELARWMEYPRSPPQRRALIQHVAGHVDHIHVRFACQPHERRCESRER